ncbi:permease YjgP/YjgQ family protein [Magnetococcus marinus MC-1]|uniref:Permease YjgP/YjgQ family protein n=1 Tax=Magnetococcus marinus (strain ATCC BAA-1437 / JCM 17883 / MC-1) TaxID=156889 RepID=A0LB31_MAGMM|nr:LPS export ABC transporter permease LptG [Magnetococcus marinus]ABK45174.1 permease YjgP/YjgQ family protein [Magnetococcus marinus MC-1]
MPILFRYLLQLFLQGFVKVFSIFIALFFLMDGAEQIRRFGGRDHVIWQDMVELIFLRMPHFFTQFLPPIALLTTLFVVTRLTRLNELTVIRSGGVSLVRILIPFLLGGVMVAGVQMLLLDQIVPRTNAAAERSIFRMNLPEQAALYESMVSLEGVRKDNLWIRDGGQILHAKRAYGDKRLLLEVTIFRFTPEHDLLMRADAHKATWENEGWVLHNGQIYRFNGHTTQSEPFTRMPWAINLEKEQIKRATPQPEELSLQALWKHADRLAREGYDATPYWVTLYRKLADPLTTLAAILLAFPFALRLHRMGGTFRSMLMGFITGFFMFVVVDLFTALGFGERLPPFLAAFAPVMFFICIGGFLLLHLEEDVPI